MAISDKDQQKLLDALNNKALTDENKGYWEEEFERNQTVPASKALQASEVIAGTNGSWAGSFSYSQASAFSPTPGGSNLPVLRPDQEGVPNNQNSTKYRLGLPGLPEVNFVPYSHRTNRYASKGPSLIGHPISFSVVGPTSKSPFCNWQWNIVDNSGTPGVGDTLTMANGPSGGSVATTLAAGYNITGSIANYNGGLYVVITDLGNTPGRKDPASDDVTILDTENPYAMGEIFRVESFAGGTLTLSPNKRLATYFDVSALSPAVRSINILEPYVTRMAAVPNLVEGKGKETSFILVSPETAANSDLYPPYDGGFLSDGSWIQGGFTPDNIPGDPIAYGGRVGLPIPIPTANFAGESKLVGQIEQASPFPISLSGLTRIFFTTFNWTAQDIGLVVRITSEISEGDLSVNSPESMFGYFEIQDVDLGNSQIVVKRIPEVNPSTGEVFFGPGPFQDNAGPPGTIYFNVEVFEPISAIFTGPFNFDKVNAARLQNIIDPTWSDRSTKGANPLDPTITRTPGFSAGKAQNSIFDTSVGSGGSANPGNMADLGFNIVFFAAKDDGGGNAVPDFDNPIVGNEVILNPSITTESQTISFDYSSGVLTLSTAPVPGAGCDIAPNGVIGAAGNNPRGEIVLFAACVPYSMEQGQVGPGVRVVGGDIEAALTNQSAPAYFDVFSEPTLFAIEAQTINNLSGSIFIDGVDQGQFPPTGELEILVGSQDGAYQLESYGVIGYETKIDNPPNTEFTDIYTDITLPLSIPSRSYVRLRKDIQDITGLDNTFGNSNRSNTIRFKYADLEYNLDGSVTVDVDSPKFYENWGDIFSSWVISGGETSDAGGDNILVNNDVVILNQGRRQIVPAELLQGLGFNSSGYIYVETTIDPQSPSIQVNPSLPLPGDQDILLAFWETDGVGITTLTDMRNPLTDIDQRLDILVGTWPGHTQQTTHFQTLAEAVAYVNEIMDPTNGDDGSYLRIRVVGTTDETGQTPIQINCSGLIIEGASLNDDNLVGTHGIQWGDADAPLFDLNGRNNIVIQNLAFICQNAGQPATSVPEARTFLYSASAPDNLTVLNCIFDGNNKAHGLFYSAGGSNRASFDNCIGKDLTDFGIYTATLGTNIDLRVRDCQFNSGGVQETTDITAPYKGAISLGNPALSGSHPRSVIEGNDLDGFEFGFYGRYSELSFRNNRIQSTEGPGVWVECMGALNSKIDNNSIQGCFTGTPGAGLLPPTVSAIIIDGVADSEIEVTNNYVSAITNVDPKYSIMNMLNNAIISGNTLQNRLISTTDNVKISDNTVNEITELNGTNLTVVGNTLDSVSNNSLVADIVSMNFDSNYIEGTGPSSFSARDTKINNNSFSHEFTLTSPDSGDAMNILRGNTFSSGDLILDCVTPGNVGLCVISSNVVETGGIRCNVGRSVVSDNVVGGSLSATTISLDLLGGNTTVKGNVTDQSINVVGSSCTISENIVDTSILVDGTSCTINANTCVEISCNDAGDTIISNNDVGANGILFTGTPGVRNNVQGNRVDGVVSMSTSNTCSISNNVITGDINVEAGPYIVIGNYANQIDDPSSPGVDPDPNGLVIANNFAAANPIFGAAAAGTTKDHNV